MGKRLLQMACLFIYAILGAHMLGAQSNEGALAGTVTDPSGSAVGGAVVIAANTATGQSTSTTASSEGVYRFPVLVVGNYDVNATAPGFKSAQRNGVTVQIQSTTSLDIQLTVGASTEKVEVNANAPQLQTESSDVGTVVSPRQVLDLPLSTNGAAIRNSQDFVFLTPATYGTGTNGGTFEGGVSGGQAFGSEILFDGASLQVEKLW